MALFSSGRASHKAINVPVVYVARDVIILMRALSITRALEGVGPEIENFLGPEMATSEVSAIWAQKSQDFRAHPFHGPSNGFARTKIIKSKCRIKSRYIGKFLVHTAVGGKEYTLHVHRQLLMVLFLLYDNENHM